MKKQVLKSSISAFNKSLEKLKDSLVVLDKTKVNDEYFHLLEDAVIKRFEIAFEYCWKMMKIALEYQGVEAFGPRPAIQEATGFGWIKNPEFWAEALDARNGSVHDYFGIRRSDYIKLVRKFIQHSERAMTLIEQSI